jgi:hypothetical protein
MAISPPLSIHCIELMVQHQLFTGAVMILAVAEQQGAAPL